MCAIIKALPVRRVLFWDAKMKSLSFKFKTLILLLVGILFGGIFTPALSTFALEPSSLKNIEQLDDAGNSGTVTDPESTPDAETPPDSNADTDTDTNTDAESPSDENGESPDDNGQNPADTGLVNTCGNEAEGLSWILCSAVGVVSNLSDTIYHAIEDILVVKPITTDTNSAVYKVWEYMRNFTNIIFVIFIVIVIYSQITGLGISNYGIKRVLPRIIIATILVNLSFIISAIAVDISNIIGGGLSEIFNQVITDTGLNDISNPLTSVDWSVVTNVLLGATAIAGTGLVVVGAGGLGAAFWTVVIALIGALISVVIGLITIGLRQALVMILIMISPLAFVAYLLPNTEKWFEKWKNLLFQMLFFYPMFSFLFGASKLAGLALIVSSNGHLFEVIIGLAVQIMPLFMSVSLFKMSGTILGKVSSGLDKAFNHAKVPLQGWAASHAEENRRRYLGRNRALGSRLRNYLNYRQTLRTMNIEQNDQTFKERATTKALDRTASYKGLDATGRPSWKRYANHYTKDAQRANTQKLLSDVARQNLTNSLSEHGDLFHGLAGRRAGVSARAFEEFTKQQFWAENIAQGDQEYLINKFFNAAEEATKGRPYEYNRLIKGAAGSQGYLGERTVMGQIVMRSVEIENRRRREALIVTNKFGYRKDFRCMIFDRLRMNDDGFAVDEYGNRLEDDHYRPLDGAKIEHWDKYIGVHKKTHREITKAEYDALSDKKRAQYDKVRYMEIKNDNGAVMQRVYENDAGYMKELIRKDMEIADPLTARYLAEIGLKRLPDGKIDPIAAEYASEDRTGVLRKFHSTIASAMLETRFKEHMGEATSMLAAQIDAGNITSPEQLNIARCISLAASGKPGSFLQNDAFFFKFWQNVLPALEDEEVFKKYFPDHAIALYRDQNGKELNGLRLVQGEDGHLKWEEINSTSPDITLEDKRNYVKHKVLTKAAKQIIGMTDRRVSPNVLDSLKPGAAEALTGVLDTLEQLGLKNVDPNVPFEQRLNPDVNIYGTVDPNVYKQMNIVARRHIENKKRQTSRGSTTTDATTDDSDIENPSSSALARLALAVAMDNQYHTVNPGILQEVLDDNTLDFKQKCSLINTYFHNNDALREYAPAAEDIIAKYTTPPSGSARDTASYIARGTGDYSDALYDELASFMDGLPTDIVDSPYYD